MKQTKSLFQSKTAVAGFLTSLAGAASYFVPSVGEFVASNASNILIGIGILSIILRRVTKDKYTLFPGD